MIYDYLPTYHQVEPNNLKGLQPGFVVAQMNVADSAKAALTVSGSNGKIMENGVICSISKDGIIAPTANSKNLFIHFSEPLNTVMPNTAWKFFAVNLEEECPRLVQLIPGDEWMSDIEYDLTGALQGRIVEIKEGDGQYDQDDWYSVSTLPDGTAAHHYMFIG